MKSYEHTSMSLFAVPIQYIIPPNQRNYVWNQEAHWQPMWEDIHRLVVKSLDNQNGNHAHFFGALITKALDSRGNIFQHVVIDGQQRITTLQMLMLATSNVLNEVGGKTASDQIKDLIVNMSHAQLSASLQYKILPKGKDYEGFENIMRNVQAVTDGNNGTTLTSCKIYFEGALRSLFANDDYDDTQIIDALVNVLKSKLNFVEIRITEDENEFMIFESLNARGAPLTEWEKSKNYVLAVASSLFGEVDEVYDEFIEVMDGSSFWREIRALPRFQGPRSDVFFMYWAHIEMGMRYPENRLYREFRRHVDDQLERGAESYQEMLRRMKHFMSIFEMLETHPDDGSQLGWLLYRQRTLNISSVTPLMMLLVDKLEGHPDLMHDALAMLESYLMRRYIVNARTSGIDGSVDRAVSDIRSLVTAEAVVETLRLVLVDARWRSRWPEDWEIRSSISEKEMYRYGRSANLRLVLEGVADHITPQYASLSFDVRGKLTLEHIVPQEWEKHWVPDGDEPDPSHFSRLHRLGNLTLVTPSMNAKLSNNDWETKRKWLSRDNLYLNQDIVDHVPEAESWGNDHIDARADRLANAILEIWPRPDDAASN